MSGRTVLAVDGGNSKADFVHVSDDGGLLGALRGATVSHQMVGFDEARRRIGASGRQVLATAGKPTADLGVYGLAGADLSADIRRLLAGIRAESLSEESILVNDATAALRAGTRSASGVALVCGAGTNGFARSPSGRTARYLALGAISGDWGGGGDIGLAALGAANRSRDRRGIKTVLERRVPEHFQMSSPERVSTALESGEMEWRRLDGLVPIVFAAAREDDRAAREIVDRQSDELARMAHGLARRVGISNREIDVVLAGGVFKGYEQGFMEDLRRRIEVHLPRARLVRSNAPPVVGAALLGLDQLAGGLVLQENETRLRKELAAWEAAL